METVKQRKDESRQGYLVRVTITYLREVYGMDEGTIKFDVDGIDGACLADDLENEFDPRMKDKDDEQFMY